MGMFEQGYLFHYAKGKRRRGGDGGGIVSVGIKNLKSPAQIKTGVPLSRIELMEGWLRLKPVLMDLLLRQSAQNAKYKGNRKTGSNFTIRIQDFDF